jgi:hypothetical protein
MNGTIQNSGSTQTTSRGSSTVAEGTDKSLECLYSGVISLPCLHTKITLRDCLTSDKMMAPLMTKRLGQFRGRRDSENATPW